MTKKKINILLIDDDPLILMTMLHCLSEKEYGMVAVNSPDIVVSSINPQGFDVIITDYKMQPIDGIALIKHLRESGFSGKIILISALLGPGRVAADELNIDAFFQKPFEIEDLHKKIKEWIG